MLKKLIFGALVLAGLASCGSKKTAFNYSENFVKKEQALLPHITSTENSVERFVGAGQYDSIAVAGEKMEGLVDEALQEVKKAPAPDVKEGENFKEACLKYFAFIKSMYTGYKDFGKAATQADREVVKTRLLEIINGKADAMSAIQTAQKKFADANGFKLEAGKKY